MYSQEERAHHSKLRNIPNPNRERKPEDWILRSVKERLRPKQRHTLLWQGVSIPDGRAGQYREGTEGEIKGGSGGDIGRWEERQDSK